MAKKRRYRVYHCLYCLSKGKTKTEAKIHKGDRKIVGLDRPYINLNFHRKCLKIVEGTGSLDKRADNTHKFVQDNSDLWYNK